MLYSPKTFSSEEGTTESSLKALNNHLRKMNESVRVVLHHFSPQAIRCSLKDLVPYDLVRPQTTLCIDIVLVLVFFSCLFHFLILYVFIELFKLQCSLFD